MLLRKVQQTLDQNEESFAGLVTGYVEAPSWNVSLRKSHHEGLITFETSQRIQGRLIIPAEAPARKDTSEDFPLRGFILCADCETPMTACWSKSKTGDKHPYYMCKKKGCESYRKSIRRAELEGDFETLLKGMQPTQGLFEKARGMFLNLWDMRLTKSEEHVQSYGRKSVAVQK